MTSKAAVDEFLAQEALAVVGASRSGRKFGNAVVRELAANGYRVYPVHPGADVIEGRPCWRSLGALPSDVGGVVTSVPPSLTEAVVREAVAAGVKRVWMVRGSCSSSAAAFCAEHGVTAIGDECILMFLERGPAIHRLHRWVRGVFNRLPRD